MKKLFSISILLFIFVVGAMTQSATQHEYVGVSKCKTCHKKAKDGDQYKIWQESKHATAYKTLASDESKKIAKEKGIADPQKAPECLKCHVTAYNVDKKYIGKKFSIEDGVGCESCHGPGADYKKKKTMEGIRSGKIDGAALGYIKPDEKLCKTCHNSESPTFKSFDYKKMAAKIAHMIPKK